MLKIAIGIVLIGVLAIVGYYTLSNGPAAEVSQNLTKGASENLDLQKKIICNYSDGEFDTTAYIKEGQARVDGVSASGNTSSIIKGNTTWHWDPATKAGITLTLDDSNRQAVEDIAGDFISKESLDDKLDSSDSDCRNEDFDDSLLEVPSDVTFQDMSTQMNEMMDKIPQDVRDQIPEEYRQYLPE